jgi:hypothetical protein
MRLEVVSTHVLEIIQCWHYAGRINDAIYSIEHILHHRVHSQLGLKVSNMFCSGIKDVKLVGRISLFTLV